MRKFRAIGILTVGVLSLFFLPSFASAAVIFPPCYDVVGTGCWLNAGHTGNGLATFSIYSGTYPIYGAMQIATVTSAVSYDSINGCGGGYPCFYFMDYSGGDFRVYQYNSSGSPDNIYGESTRYISVTPVGGSFVATGTRSIGFTAYVNLEEFSGGESYFNFIVTPLDAINPIDAEAIIFSAALGNDFMYATTTGLFSFSTTTDFQVLGNYKIESRFYTANCGIFGFTPGFCYSQFMATSSSFVVGTTSAFRNVSRQVDSAIREAIASTTIQIASVCAPFSSSFSIVPCMVSLVVPSTEVISADLVLLKTLPPWGYGFRFYDIVTDDNLVALPVASFPIPGSSVNLVLTPWDFLFGTTSILSNAEAKMTLNGVEYGDGSSFRDVAEPFWNFFWTFFLGLSIVFTLFGRSSIKTEKQ